MSTLRASTHQIDRAAIASIGPLTSATCREIYGRAGYDYTLPDGGAQQCPGLSADLWIVTSLSNQF